MQTIMMRCGLVIPPGFRYTELINGQNTRTTALPGKGSVKRSMASRKVVARLMSAAMRQALLVVVVTALSACSWMPAKKVVPTSTFAGAPLEYLPALRGDYFPITAAESNRPFHIYVRLPEGYDPAQSTAYPVIYILDGDSLFPLLAPTHLFLHYDEQVPEAILVGVSYGSFDPATNKRNIDFSAPANDARAGEVGAPQFLSFLKTQLIPEVERRYKANPQRRVLVGQSRSGFFVLWSALRDPGLFWASMASNASYSPGSETLYQAPGVGGEGRRHVAVVSGTRDAQARMQGAEEWVRHWKSRPNAPWEVRHFVLQQGTHAASIGQAYRDVMVWLFSNEIAASKSPGAGQ